MIEYQKELLRVGRDFRTNLAAKNPNDPALAIIDADLLVREALVNRLGDSASGLMQHECKSGDSGKESRISMSRFLREWNKFSPEQRARLGPILKNTTPPEGILDGEEYLNTLQVGMILGKSIDRARQIAKEGGFPGTLRDSLNRYWIPRQSILSYRVKPVGRPPKTNKD